MSGDRDAGSPAPASSSAGGYAVASGRRSTAIATGLRAAGRGRGWSWSSAARRAGRGCRRRSSTGTTRRRSFPDVARGFWLNVKLFLISEPLILVLGLAVALARSARSPWLAPLRVAAVVYTDLFRGIPTILLVLLLGFGVPALQLQGVTTDPFFWAAVALVLSYGAYVAEVFRAGIDSIHPSQVASADALGLSPRPDDALRRRPAGACAASSRRCSTTSSRCRRTPPWSSAVGVFDALFAARDYANFNFNYTPFVVVALLLHRADGAAGPVHRLARPPVRWSARGRVRCDRRC